MDPTMEKSTKTDITDNPPSYSEATTAEEPPPSYQTLSKDPFWVQSNNTFLQSSSPSLTEDENINLDRTDLKKMKWELTTRGIRLPIISYKNDIV
ncbi:UNVERIFIED_CONTAM: hypothetical protein RMT77_002678 [Armadillidium vulgare]